MILDIHANMLMNIFVLATYPQLNQTFSLAQTWLTDGSHLLENIISVICSKFAANLITREFSYLVYLGCLARVLL